MTDAQPPTDLRDVLTALAAQWRKQNNPRSRLLAEQAERALATGELPDTFTNQS